MIDLLVESRMTSIDWRVFQKRSQLTQRFVSADFAQALGLNLPNSLASDFELLSDFFECAGAAIGQLRVTCLLLEASSGQK